MKAEPKWINRPPQFWHYVRVISQHLGYARKGEIYRHEPEAIERALRELELSVDALRLTPIPGLSVGELAEYFDFRADLIHGTIAANLQNASEAKKTFEQVVEKFTTGMTPQFKGGKENSRLYRVNGGVPVVVPYNKQKGDKRDIDFLTGTTNILLSYYLGGESFDQDPRQLPVVTEDGVVSGSMSRRMDGAYPDSVNPSAIWEFKCYYYTTTFGSKISDAVYITDLDGYERGEILKASHKRVENNVFLDAYSVFMEQGLSFLVRLVDMLQRGAVDNLVFGKEVLTAVPEIVKGWQELRAQSGEADA
uniref:Yga2E n=1 Tax=Corynebacterium glutamicum TaxID=1718 RepID=Q84GD2_CORGT|nr:hypothetical protein [Corynebacterium glutamicum]AAO18218.1 Yga2E [Corynebacterium glutamicum]